VNDADLDEHYAPISATEKDLSSQAVEAPTAAVPCPEPSHRLYGRPKPASPPPTYAATQQAVTPPLSPNEVYPKRMHAFSRPFEAYFVTHWFLMLFFQVSFPLYVLQLLPDGFFVRVIIGAVFQVLVICSMVTAVWVGTRDNEDECVKRANRPPDTSYVMRKGMSVIDRRTGMCRVCCVEVDFTTRHCKRCNKCVAGHDHHCRWLNCCIGSANLKSFYLMLGLMMSAALVESIVVFRIFMMYIREPERFTAYAIDRFNLPLETVTVIFFVILVGTVITFLGLFQLVILHLQLHYMGATTAEWIRQKRRRMRRKRDRQKKLEEGVAVDDDCDSEGEENPWQKLPPVNGKSMPGGVSLCGIGK